MNHPHLCCPLLVFTATLLLSQSNSIPFAKYSLSPLAQDARDTDASSLSYMPFRPWLNSGRSPRFGSRFRGLPFGKGASSDAQATAAFTFEIAPTYGSGGQEALSVAVGDLNGDGKPDLVVADVCSLSGCPSGEVSVLLGNGDGTFRTAVAYSSGGNEASSVALADVNRDGRLDIVVTNRCASSSSNCGVGQTGMVAVLLGNGDGTFQAPATYASGGVYATSVAVADVNGDGKPDLLVTNQEDKTYSTGLVSVLLGKGDGTFHAAAAYDSGGYGAASVAVADLDGSGKLDLVVAQCESSDVCAGAVGVLLGNGDGTFRAAVTYASGGLDANAVVIGDVNGDEKLDVVVANGYANSSECGGVGVLLGNGDGTFQTAVTYNSGGYDAGSLVVADVNGDGIPDLLVANCAGSEEACSDGNNAAVGVLLGNGDGTFQTAAAYASGGYDGVAIAAQDVNGDGKPDLLVVNFDVSGSLQSSVGVLLGNGNGTFRAAPIYASGGSPTFSDAAGDVNGDGKPDLVIALGCCSPNGANGGVAVLLGNGDGTFQTALTYDSGGYSARSVAVADVNGDGKLDVVVANECVNESSCSGEVSVLVGNGDGTFQTAASYGSGGYYADSVVVADVNGDGNPDIVVANECANSSCTSSVIGVLLGNGDGTFQAPVIYGSGGYYATSLAVADLNGDGILDVLVANECALGSNCGSSGKVGLLWGNGDGTFRTAVTYDSGGQYPCSLAVGDVNGDGNLDLVVTNLYANSGTTKGSLGVLLGEDDGTLHSATTTPIPAYGLGAIVLGDFNGDGKLDVASGDAMLLLGNGNGTFQSFTSLGAGGFGIAVGDFNLDNKPDLAVGGVAVLMNIRGAATTTALVSSPNPSRSSQSVTFTATVSSLVVTPSGEVSLMNGTTILETKVLSNGTASFFNSKLPTGSNSITAVYAGGGKSNSNGSTSAPLNQVVLAPTTTTLSSSPNPSSYGQAVTFTAVVNSSDGTLPNGGTVSFEQDKQILGTGTLTGSSASFTISTLTAGNHPVTAFYGGDSIHAESSSKTLKQKVNKAVK